MDRARALEILDLRENATADDVTRRYNVIFKKYKYADIDEKGITKEQVEEAYRLLMGLDYRDPVAERQKKRRKEHPNPLFKLLRVDEEKARNAVYYYKWKVLIAIIAVIGVLAIIMSFVNRVNPDLKIVFTGEIVLDDTDRMETAIKTSMETVKAPQVQCVTVSDKLDAQLRMVSQQKITAEMMGGKNDIYIMDLDTYKEYAGQGAFQPLDDLKGELGIKDAGKDLEVPILNEDGTEAVPPKLYGVDVSKSPMLRDCGVEGDTLIAALFANGDNPGNAKAYLKILIESVQ